MITRCPQCGRCLNTLDEVENAVCDVCMHEDLDNEEEYQELDFNDEGDSLW